MAHEAGVPAAGARPVVPRMLTGLLAVVFAALLIKSAWISDDAAISLRSVLNVTHGFGLTFNIAERVQTFTHPLWLFALTGAYLVVGNIFVGTIVVSVLLSVTAFLLATTRALTVWQAGVAAIVLLFSRAFVDFSVSGLENPLFNLLIALFLWLFVGLPANDRRRLPGLWTVVSLLYLTRPDAVLLVAPLAIVATIQARRLRSAAAAIAVGSVPAAVWTFFATIYYGFPFPNTAYAKLATDVDAAELRQQGWLYLVDSLDRDPITLTTIGFAIGVGAVSRHAAARSLAAGIVLYLGYIVWIGGDFMSGRFLAAPLFAAVLLCTWLVVAPREVWLGAAAVLALVGSTAAHVPLWMHSGVVDPSVKPNGIMDERGVYFRDRSLVLASRQRFRNPPWPTDMGVRPRMRVVDTCGLMGQAALDLGPVPSPARRVRAGRPPSRAAAGRVQRRVAGRTLPAHDPSPVSREPRTVGQPARRQSAGAVPRSDPADHTFTVALEPRSAAGDRPRESRRIRSSRQSAVLSARRIGRAPARGVTRERDGDIDRRSGCPSPRHGARHHGRRAAGTPPDGYQRGFR